MDNEQRQAALEELLARIGKTFSTRFEPLNVDDQPLQVLAIDNMPEHLDGLLRKKAIHDPLRDLPLWAKIWPASFVLGRFLRKFAPEGKTLLELGAGMGVCGMIASRYGFSRVVCTDLAGDALDFARANILRNNLDHVMETGQLDISRPGKDPRFPEGFDVIAASELLYLDDLHKPLLKFIDRHLAKNGKAFFCSDLSRARPRFQKLAARTFRTTEGKVGLKSIAGEEEERRIYSILILEKQ